MFIPSDPKPGQPIIKWSEGGEHPGQTALLDYIDAALDGLRDDALGRFTSAQAYETFKRRIRQEYIDKMMLIAGGK